MTAQMCVGLDTGEKQDKIKDPFPISCGWSWDTYDSLFISTVISFLMVKQ